MFKIRRKRVLKEIYYFNFIFDGFSIRVNYSFFFLNFEFEFKVCDFILGFVWKGFYVWIIIVISDYKFCVRYGVVI